MKNDIPQTEDANRSCAEAAGSAPWVVIVGSPRELLTGQFLEGPREPRHVRIYGYGFTRSLYEAWNFPTEKQARAKALIVDRHMGWARACWWPFRGRLLPTRLRARTRTMHHTSMCEPNDQGQRTPQGAAENNATSRNP